MALFNPFPGLRPFEPDEEHLFFGREAETDELLRRLRSTRFLAVIGTSGSGKSSLVRSGLIPSLQSGFMVSAGSSWRIAIHRPGEDPIGHLAAALNAPDVLNTSEDEDLASTNKILIESSLRRGSLGLVEAVRNARLPRDQNILVLVDQFEELFRFRRSPQLQNSRDEAIGFVRVLLEAAKQHDLPVYIVLTMRSDFISECMHFPGLSDAVNTGLYLVGRMGRDALRSAIMGPVAVGGGTIAPRLVHRVLNDLGDDHDQLPLVQHALMRTWEHWASKGTPATPLDIEDYEAIGGFRQALSQHAEEAYDEAAAAGGAHIAERMFKALTDTVSDVPGVRRPTAIGELAPICDASEEEVARIVEIFRQSGRSFLMPPPVVPLTSHSIIDLSHESLMRCWTRLIRWAEEERAAAGFYARLAQAALWHEQGTVGLWRNPELQLAQRWMVGAKPTKAWARRYDESFERAMAFLDKSEREQHRADVERERERKAKLRRAQWVAGVLGTSLVIAVALATIAWRENLRAEMNLGLARTAVDESLTTAERDPASMGADVPEMEQFRQELLEKARSFYAAFMDQDPRSEISRRDMVESQYRLGHIGRLLHQPEEAQKQYRTAIAGFERLSNDYPHQPDYRQGLANAYNWLAETLRPLPLQAEEAQRAYDNALQVQRALVQQHPQTAIYRRELARTLYNRGILRWSAEHTPLAESDFRESIAVLEPLAADPLAAQELARAYNNLASLRITDNPGEAEALYQRAIDTDERLVGEYPENREYKLELAKYHNNFAALLHDRNQGTRAAAHSERALALIEELSRLAPSLAIERADAYNLHAMVLQPQAPATAVREYQEALDLFTQLRRDPAAVTLPEFHQRLGDLLLNLAAFFERTKNVEVARDLSRAVALYADVATAAIASGSPAQGQLVANTLASVLADLPEVHQRRLRPLYEQLQKSQTPGTGR